MNLKVPYSKIELQIALMSASVKVERYINEHGEAKTKEFMDSMVSDVGTPAQINEGVATLHGITVTDLINSPNYSVLKQEFLAGKMKDVRDNLKQTMGLDDSEAWAVIMADMLDT